MNATPEIVSSATPNFVTATLPPTSPPQSPPPPLPPTVIPTIPPVEGKTTTEVNVRAEPSTASESFGVVAPFSLIQVVGKDASEKWFQILFADAPNGVGWVRADYVQVNASAEIPVREVEAGPGAARGVVLRGVNVRSGPGQDFKSLGLLNEADVVSILGRDSSGAWTQIKYAGSPDGLGWVAADYLQVEDVSLLPVIGEAAPTVGIEAGGMPLDVVGSILTAQPDGDSAEMPLAVVALGDVQAVQIQGEVSWPDGDTKDWVAFSTQGARVVIQVLCETGGLELSFLEAGEVIESFLPVCNSEFEINVSPNHAYMLGLSPLPGEAVLVRFTLRIRVFHL